VVLNREQVALLCDTGKESNQKRNFCFSSVIVGHRNCDFGVVIEFDPINFL
jgi:hypothetical protein